MNHFRRGCASRPMRAFHDADAGHWQVSNGGGGSPVWSADGKELYFLNGSNRLIAAEIGPGPAFSVTKLDRLFDATAFGYAGYHWAFDATRDGKFVYLGPRAPRSQSPSLTLALMVGGPQPEVGIHKSKRLCL